MILSKSELKFKVRSSYKGMRVWLRVWKDRLYATGHPDNTIVIYMRLAGNDFSIPFTLKNYNLCANDDIVKSLLEFGSFTFSIDNEEKILAILSKLKSID